MQYFDTAHIKEFEIILASLHTRVLFEKIASSTIDDISFEYLLEASAVYSSNIEGNTIDVNSFMNSKLRNVQVTSQKKEIQEIIDLKSAYDFARENPLNEYTFKKAHEILSRQFVIKAYQGTYRDTAVGVYSSKGLVYMAIEPDHVQKEITKLFATLADITAKKDITITKAFYFASMIHLHIAHIHPFTDGNGRIARLIEKWLLATLLGDTAWKIESDKYYKEHVQEYYNAINLGVDFYHIDYAHASTIDFLQMLPRSLGV